jgi:hypothetical protein
VSAAGGANASGSNATNFRVSGGQGLGTEILIDGAATPPLARSFRSRAGAERLSGIHAFDQHLLGRVRQFIGRAGELRFESGGNQFHGEAYDLIRNEKLNANSFINNLAGRNASGREILPRGRDNQNDFGFNIGGPIYLPRLAKAAKAF